MIKKDELRGPHSCLNKAAPEEPIFVLRAKDPLAAQTVRLWAAMASGVHEIDKIGEAKALADDMEAWHGKQSREVEPLAVPAVAQYRITPY